MATRIAVSEKVSMGAVGRETESFSATVIGTPVSARRLRVDVNRRGERDASALRAHIFINPDRPGLLSLRYEGDARAA